MIHLLGSPSLSLFRREIFFNNVVMKDASCKVVVVSEASAGISKMSVLNTASKRGKTLRLGIQCFVIRSQIESHRTALSFLLAVGPLRASNVPLLDRYSPLSVGFLLCFLRQKPQSHENHSSYKRHRSRQYHDHIRDRHDHQDRCHCLSSSSISSSSSFSSSS